MINFHKFAGGCALALALAGQASAGSFEDSMSKCLTKNANTATWQIGENIPKAAAGKVLYFAYFNVCHEGDCSFTIHGQGANPESESVYRGLKWGNNKLG